MEMFPPSRSMEASRNLTVVVEIYEANMMLLCYLLMLLIKLCIRSKP